MNDNNINILKQCVAYYYDIILTEAPGLEEIIDNIKEQALSEYEDKNIEIRSSVDDTMSEIMKLINDNNFYISPRDLDTLINSLQEEFDISDFDGEDIIKLINSAYNDDSRTSSIHTLCESFLIVLERLRNLICRFLYVMYIYFPEVRVSNEDDNFIDIDNLYVQLFITKDGYLADRFKMLRSSITEAQVIARYIHSHMPTLSSCTYNKFISPCLGNGPIYRTINTIKSNVDYDLWGLFFYELSIYVTVESLAGGPYIKMSTVGSNGTEPVIFTYNTVLSIYTTSGWRSLRNAIINYLIENNVLKFNYNNGYYTISNNPIDLCIVISNFVISRIQNIFSENISNNNETSNIDTIIEYNDFFKSYVIKDGILYLQNKNRNILEFSKYEGTKLFKFKGKDILFEITKKEVDSDKELKLVNTVMINSILSYLNILVNNGSAKRKIRNQTF